MSHKQLSGFKQLLSLLVIGILFVSIYSQAVEASIVWGPAQYIRTTGSPDGNGSLISNGSNDVSNGSNDVYVTFIYGPEKLTKSSGSPDNHTCNFTIDDPHGNYTLFVRNGDLSHSNSNITYNASSSAEIWLNGVEVFSPDDFKKEGGLLKKNVSLGTSNQLKVEMRSEPGSHFYVWIEDESPDIVITSPLGDTVSNGAITLAGYTTDHSIKTITVEQSNNEAQTSIPVMKGNFSAHLYISAPVKLTLSETDSTGTLRTASLCLDGDYLPMQAELQYGFDPLNPDSDSKLTVENEAGNGIPDGFEILNKAAGEKLPAFVKDRIGADPLKVDTDNDGLTDYFELMKMGLLTDVRSNDTDGNGISDANEDADNDSLTNSQEQALGTDPLEADTDGDGLKDGYEVSVSHTNPLLPDSDNDGLEDGSEVKLGTDPNNPDTNGNGILDGNETYTTTASNDKLRFNVSITGKGDMSRQVTIAREISDYYTNNSALISPLVNVSVNGSFDHAVITMEYDPVKVTDPANISLCYYNESLGLFLPVNSTVDPVNHTISADVTHLSNWGIFDLNALSDLYSTVATFNDEIAGYVSGSASIVQNIVNDGLALLSVTKTYTVDPRTNSVVIKDRVTFPDTRTTVKGAAPTPTPTPTPTTGPLDYSPVVITMNNKGQTNWFGQGASYPAGVYRINATGWYTHWYPPASTLACIDQGPDQNVRMYAWSNRGNNYPYPGVSDANRLGMHIKYGSSDSPVYAIRIEPGTLQFNHTGGKIGIWDNDDNYNDNTYSLSYTLSYMGVTPPAQDLTDTDGDGLPDKLEIHGWMDTQGNVYYTDPNKKDTDDDGLTDGQEAGIWVQLYQMKYFQIKSDPTRKDTDGDGIWDKTELDNGMNPWSMDTDSDSFLDPYDPQPTTYNEVNMNHNLLDVIRIIQIGAAYRETGLEGGAYYNMVGDRVANSPYYTMGCKMPKYVKSWVEKILKLYSYEGNGGGR